MHAGQRRPQPSVASPYVQGVAAAVSRSLRRGALAAAAIVFSIASLAACGAGNDAQTLEVKPDNAATRSTTSRSRTPS